MQFTWVSGMRGYLDTPARSGMSSKHQGMRVAGYTLGGLCVAFVLHTCEFQRARCYMQLQATSDANTLSQSLHCCNATKQDTLGTHEPYSTATAAAAATIY
jgi:hypothetical protein